MKTLLALSAALLLQACGRAPVIEPEFQTYVKSFEQAAQINVLSDMELSDELPSGRAGNCNLATRVIKINRAEWKVWPTSLREQILFHELGHCELGRVAHDESVKPDRNPKSIMHPSFGVIAKYWKANRDAYLQELIAGRQDR